jgi:lysophospholipase L1-like esterase
MGGGLSRGIGVLGLLGLLACIRAKGADTAEESSRMSAAEQGWVAVWSAAQQLAQPQDLPPSGLSEQTLRQVVRLSMGGPRLRVRLSNAFGDRPLEIRAARIARSAGGDAVVPDGDHPLAFGGKSSVTLPAGAEIASDPVDFAVSGLTKVALSLAFGRTPQAITGHPGWRATAYLAPGDQARSLGLEGTSAIEHGYVLAGIDVAAGAGSATVVAIGDSITDGRGSTTDGFDRWTDVLAERLQSTPATRNIAVLNQGIGGNAVLAGGLGPTASERFARDALGPSGVRWVIVFEGVNDIGAARDSAVAGALVAAYRRFASAARERSLRVYGATILPFGGSQYASEPHEAARRTVNQWIRTSGAFDAVVDFDAAVSDPSDPSRLDPRYDGGDHLHLNPAGYRALASAVDLGLFAD